MHTPREVEELGLAAESWPPEEVLRWASAKFADDMEIASAFGAEGIVLIDLASRILPTLKVFIVDTGFLFPQTLDLARKVERRYGIQIERVVSEITPDLQDDLYQPTLWNREPDLCCRIRKVETLRKKLANLKAWITAIRRSQTPARSAAAKVEWDSKFQLMKINPLADWTHEMVWEYIRKHQLPYNPLHDQNYPSIGCIQCTRPVRAGENPRAGRWSAFSKQECGLHAQDPNESSTLVRPEAPGRG